VATGPIHENGILNAPMVSAQRFHGGGCRPVFGLWAAYSIAASHPRLRQCVGSSPSNVSFPLPLRDSTGFTPVSRLTNPNQGLTCMRSFYMDVQFHGEPDLYSPYLNIYEISTICRDCNFLQRKI